MAARSTRMTSDLVPDDPLEQDAEYDFDAVDRQYIDTQVRATQLHASRLINGRYETWYRVDGSSATLSAGDVVCSAATGTSEKKVTLATPAALAVARVALGVVVEAASPGARVRVAALGVVESALTGLGVTEGYVRVSSAGRPERVASYSAGDFPLGTVDAAGFLSLGPGISIGAGGAGAFSYIELGAGTKPTSGLIRVASGAEMYTARTTGGANNIWLADNGADGLRIGNSSQAARVDLSVKTGGEVRWLVNDVEKGRLDVNGVNIETGMTYAVNDVGHATAATASSLAFRGSAGELSVTRLYGAGTVHPSAMLSVARNLTIIGGKTSGGTDHPILTEDGSDGFVHGSPTLTQLQEHHVKSGGWHAFEVDDVAKLTVAGALVTVDTALTVSGALTASGQVLEAGEAAANVGTNQNNYATGTATTLALTATAAFNLTGLAGGAAGRRLTITNPGSFSITLTHEDGSSTAANRLTCPGAASFIVAPGETAVLKYRAATSRWAVLGPLVATTTVNNAVARRTATGALDAAAYAVSGVAIAGQHIAYTPASSADWNADPPNDVKEALDRMAAAVASGLGPIA